MDVKNGNILLRDDTMFGICQGVAEDFGFNPLWLRLTLGLSLLAYPVAGIAAYAALGVPVLAARLLFPNPREAKAAAAEPVTAQAAGEAEPLPLAA